MRTKILPKDRPLSQKNPIYLTTYLPASTPSHLGDLPIFLLPYLSRYVTTVSLSISAYTSTYWPTQVCH
jgi:hypothetical protein